jgi:hypothetical protein
MRNITLTLTGHITPADKIRSDYLYVPFDLPAPVSRLHVRYHYTPGGSEDQREGGNVIDIGLFDPLGADFPAGAGFRGWSGAARSEFTLTPNSATPGYLPGPLPAGRYQIILGLYQIQPEGASYEVEIEASLQASEQLPVASAPPPATITPTSIASQPRFWLRGDLHSHTEHSDAHGTLAQLTAKARALGLDFLAVTDHNTVSHHPYLPALAGDDLLLIEGQEVTSYYGHMNIWGTHRWCDFRCRTSEDMAKVIALAHDSDGLCSINHPKRLGPAWKYDLALPVDALEVWQAPWPSHNTESLALWDRLLVGGRRLPAVGGSDYHCPAGEETSLMRLGWPTTWVKVGERSVPAVLDAIRSGRVAISATADGPRLDLQARAGGTDAEMGQSLSLAADDVAEVEVQVEHGAGWMLRLIADGAVAAEALVTTSSATLRFSITARCYLRAELVGDAPQMLLPSNIPADLNLHEWCWALSNPIYINRM